MNPLERSPDTGMLANGCVTVVLERPATELLLHDDAVRLCRPFPWPCRCPGTASPAPFHCLVVARSLGGR